MNPTPEEVSKEFLSLSVKDRLQLLLEYSENLPDLPAKYSDSPELLEKVEECQSPVYLFVEVEPEKVGVFITAPEEAPTTRGFAGILHELLNGQTPETILDLNDDFPNTLGLSDAISPLRMRGMRAMLYRIKRQVTEKSGS